MNKEQEALKLLVDEIYAGLKLFEYELVSTDSDYETSTEEESEEELESVKEEYKIEVDDKGFYSLRDCIVKLETIKQHLTREK